MANYLINLFKSAPKGDAYRTADVPNKYTQGVSALNASGANKSGTPPAKVGSGLPKPVSSGGNTKVPGL